MQGNENATPPDGEKKSRKMFTLSSMTLKQLELLGENPSATVEAAIALLFAERFPSKQDDGV